MNGISDSFIRRKRDGQQGQVLVLMAFLLVALLSAAALVIDIGDIYYSYQELESATMSAAMNSGFPVSSATIRISLGPRKPSIPTQPASAPRKHSSKPVHGPTPFASP